MLFLFPWIAFAQMQIGNVRKMKTGKVVTVSGIVTATFGELSFVTDATGGIAVYQADVEAGDSISVTGKLSKYNGMLEIIVDSVGVFGSGGEILPVLMTIVDAMNHEGELVRIEDVTMQPAGLFFYPQRAGIAIHNKDTIQYWIDENTDIPGYVIPEKTDITGVVGRFGNRVQLLPRGHLDFSLPISHYPLPIDHFSVVNWNVEFFGAPRYGPPDDSLQIANVATILTASKPDVAALQEVSNDDAFHTLLDLLPNYEGRCSSRYSYSFDTNDDFPPQKLCFVYNPATVKVIREKILFRQLFDDHPSEMFSTGRLPYSLEVEVGGHRLFLINLHAKSGADESDYQRRVADAGLLKDSLDQFYRYKDFILLGDLNDDVDQSILAAHESPYAALTTDYPCISRSLSDAGWHSTIAYDDMIDHQVVSSSLLDYHVTTQVLNPFSVVALYGRTTSDHLPVISEFDFDKSITGLAHDGTGRVYPNPTSGDIWFPPASNITVIDAVGDVVIKKQGAYPPISLSEHAPGLYLVVLDDQIYRIVKK